MEESDFKNLKTKNLLLVVPHFRTFIKDQSVPIKSYFNDVIVLMPTPYFSRAVFRLPYVSKYFRFLKFNLDSYDSNYTFISPKFFTLPVELLWKRNCYLTAKSCTKALSKNTVNFDLMHAHFMEHGFIGANLKSLYNKPFVLTAHGGDVYELPFRDDWHNALAKYILHEADQVITVSQFNAEKLLSLGVSPSKLHVIPNGYNETLFKPIPLSEAREKLRLPFNKKVLLTVGNLVKTKGHTYLIDAMHFVLKKRSDVILIIVGTGLLKEELQKKVDKQGLSDRIFFVGYKRHEEIPVWMNACDIFVLPSLQESFGVVIVEAMACGKAVIATTVGGIPEIIRRNDVGLLVKPADAKSLAEGILEALDKKWNSEQIIIYAKGYSWANIAKRILKVYSKTLCNM